MHLSPGPAQDFFREPAHGYAVGDWVGQRRTPTRAANGQGENGEEDESVHRIAPLIRGVVDGWAATAFGASDWAAARAWSVPPGEERAARWSASWGPRHSLAEWAAGRPRRTARWGHVPPAAARAAAPPDAAPAPIVKSDGTPAGEQPSPATRSPEAAWSWAGNRQAGRSWRSVEGAAGGPSAPEA